MTPATGHYYISTSSSDATIPFFRHFIFTTSFDFPCVTMSRAWRLLVLWSLCRHLSINNARNATEQLGVLLMFRGGRIVVFFVLF
jgi:hypothetical protein